MNTMRTCLFALAFLSLAACSAQDEQAPPRDRSGDIRVGEVDTEPDMPPEPKVAPAEEIVSAGDDFDWPQTDIQARISTSMGAFTVELYQAQAPQTVANFLQYAAEGHYDRTIFHRVVGGFVIQGGGYSQYFSERPTRDPIPYEGDNGLRNFRGTLAMARTMDPDSAAAQWYVNVRDNLKLDHISNELGKRPGYTVFGRVVDGMEVVDAIGRVATGPGGPFPSEAPLEPVIIERVERVVEQD